MSSPLTGSGTLSRAAITAGSVWKRSQSASSANSSSSTVPQLCRCQDQSDAPLLNADSTMPSPYASAHRAAEDAPSKTSIENHIVTLTLVRRPLGGNGRLREVDPELGQPRAEGLAQV